MANTPETNGIFHSIVDDLSDGRFINYKRVTQYFDGSPMNQEKASSIGDLYHYFADKNAYGIMALPNNQVNPVQLNIPQSYNANTGVEVSKELQLMFDFASATKTTVYFPKSSFLTRYPIFVSSDTQVKGEGNLLANINLFTGRCAILVGDCHEWNREQVEYNRENGILGAIHNDDYQDVPLEDGFTITSSDPRIKARNWSIDGLSIVFDYYGGNIPWFDNSERWGGYGVQASHAADGVISNLKTYNACQATGIGSDSGASTPACVNVRQENITAVIPDLVHTYYSVTFFANSNNCHLVNGYSPVEMTAGTADGSVCAMNYTENCTMTNVVANVGRTQTSQLILITNGRGNKVTKFVGKNVGGAAVTFYTRLNVLDPLKPNIFSDFIIEDCLYLVAVTSKYDKFQNISGTNITYDISFLNVNATNNTFNNVKRDVLIPPPGENFAWPIINNKFDDYGYVRSRFIPQTETTGDSRNIITAQAGITDLTTFVPSAGPGRYMFLQPYWSANYYFKIMVKEDVTDKRLHIHRKVANDDDADGWWATAWEDEVYALNSTIEQTRGVVSIIEGVDNTQASFNINAGKHFAVFTNRRSYYDIYPQTVNLIVPPTVLYLSADPVVYIPLDFKNNGYLGNAYILTEDWGSFRKPGAVVLGKFNGGVWEPAKDGLVLSSAAEEIPFTNAQYVTVSTVKPLQLTWFINNGTKVMNAPVSYERLVDGSGKLIGYKGYVGPFGTNGTATGLVTKS